MISFLKGIHFVVPNHYPSHYGTIVALLEVFFLNFGIFINKTTDSNLNDMFNTLTELKDVKVIAFI